MSFNTLIVASRDQVMHKPIGSVAQQITSAHR